MPTMNAAYIEKTGPSEEIKFGQLPVPRINDDQVLVKVKTAAFSHIDNYVKNGQTSYELKFPYILGHDFCGIVDSVGKNVREFKPGQRVWSNTMGIHGRQGSFAQYAAVDEKNLNHLPENTNEVEAVSVLQSGTTACIGLMKIAKLMPNEVIFINGGSGNVGSCVIQLAKERGAKIIATAGDSEKMEWCLTLGANHAVNYKTENLEKSLKSIAPEGINIYWDTTREPNMEVAIPLLAKKGRVIMMAGYNAHPTLPVGQLYRKDCSILGFSINNASPDDLSSAAVMINFCLQQGKLKTRIAHVLPIQDINKAQKLFQSDKPLWGKVVLTF